MTLLLALWTTLAAPAVAADADAEVVVVSNAFARWDDTRWYVRTQVQLPWSAALYAERNDEVAFNAYDLELVIHCQLADKLGKHAHDAICDVEDASLRLAAWASTHKAAEHVLTETVPRIRDLKLRMRVWDDGRVGGVVLEGEPESYRRVNILYENLRQMVNRAIAGFHADGPKAIRPGSEWVDNAHPLFDLPTFLINNSSSDSLPPVKAVTNDTTGPISSSDKAGGAAGGGGLSADVTAPATDFLDASGNVASDDATSRITANNAALPLGVAGPTPVATPAVISSCTVANVVALVQGHVILQSTGTGGATLGEDNIASSLRGDLNAVAVFSPENGYMGERVWAVTMAYTGSSGGLSSSTQSPYWTKGTLRQLDETEKPPLLASGYVAGPNQTSSTLPPWLDM